MDATLLSIHAGVGTITLNRPDSRNALSAELVESLRLRLDEAIADRLVRVIVLTGNGTVFCAGADLKERRTVATTNIDDDLPTLVRIFQTIQNSPKPVVGKLNGPALAGGLGLACSCDITVAPKGATFGFTEVRIGVAPAIISVICLPKLRPADAAQLFLTGERISATEAARVGLINYAVDEAELESATDAIVAKLLLGGPNALAASKSLLSRVPSFSSQDDAFRWTARLSAELFASAEAAEGMGAFAQKRSPNWG